MITWSRIQRPSDLDPPAYEATVGVLLLTVEASHADPSAWTWSIGIVGGDGAELGSGLSESKYHAKCAARRRVEKIVAEIERVLRSRRRA